MNLSFSRDNPCSTLSYLPKWNLSTSRADKKKLIVKFIPWNIKNSILNIFCEFTFYYKSATVLIIPPSIDLMEVAPLPTIPKLAAEPTAKRFGEWGDHFRDVNDVGYLIPNCLTGFSIWWIIINIYLLINSDLILFMFRSWKE
jgi:hypothetical protein